MEGLFITEVHMKEESIVDENVDAKIIRMNIYEAQESYILPILGSGLYNEIKAQIVAGTVTALNDTLLSTYIKRPLIYWTLYTGLDSFTYKIRNKGIYKQDSENSTPIDLEELKRLMDSFRNKAEMFSERLTKYLLEYQTSYPLYINPGTTVDTIHPKRNNYTTDWYLGGSRKKDSDYNPYENWSDCE